MGEEVTISLRNVSKCFNRYDKPVDRLKEIILPNRNHSQKFWALRDISFKVRRGETMGIIGRNGSGKSTLLQIICGTIAPTSGDVNVNGRVAALLELGAGFNPEFTGRENVYMNGAIMGLSKMEVNERFDNIAAFADIKDFIDRPVKTYSSGMYVRLAFSAAIHISPEILIVDEALAVGDMFFQAKCMARMRRMVDNGVTILFVSHDVGSVKSLCKSCLFLEEGNIQNIGKSEFVVNEYLKKSRHKPEETLTQIATAGLDIQNFSTESSLESIDLQQIKEEFSQLENSGYGSSQAIIEGYRFSDSAGNKLDHFQWGEKITIQILTRFIIGSENYSIGFLLRDLYGLDIFGTNLKYELESVAEVRVGQTIISSFSFRLLLQPNTYTLTLAVSVTNQMGEEVICDWHDNIFTFKITKLNSLTPETKVYIPTEAEIRIVI